MLRRTSILACLAVCTAVNAIEPGDFSSAGSTVSDPLNAEFLAAVAWSNTQYDLPAGSSTAGTNFSHENGLPPVIPGFGSHFSVRVWFVSESAGYTNSIGVTSQGTSSIIFGDSKGVSSGDYVDLFGGGEWHPDAHFFALTDVLNEGSTSNQFYVGPQGPNADHKVHLDMTSQFQDAFHNAGSLWYALALDDQFGGGDRDWNDMHLLVQICPVATPEPATIALLAGFMVIGAWLWRRQQNVLA
jgi:hypothetical protein